MLSDEGGAGIHAGSNSGCINAAPPLPVERKSRSCRRGPCRRRAHLTAEMIFGKTDLLSGGELSQAGGLLDQPQPWQERSTVGQLDREAGAGVEFQQQGAAVAI